MRIRVFLLASVVACVAGSAVAQAGNCTQTDSSTRPDCPGALAFFHGLQSALQRNDRQAVASLVSYPVLTSLHHKRVHITKRTQLLAHFDDIFDEGVRCAILSATEKDVWGNWQGFTVDGGAVWFDGIIPQGEHRDVKEPDFWARYSFKIKTINNDGQYPRKKS